MLLVRRIRPYIGLQSSLFRVSPPATSSPFGYDYRPPLSASLSTEAATAKQHPPPIIWTTHRLNQDQILKVDKLFHRILWLDIFESQMLIDLLNERMGLKMTPKQRRQLEARMMREAMGDAENTTTTEEAEVETGPVLMDVKLVGLADAKAKIKVIKGSLDCSFFVFVPWSCRL